MPAEEGLTMVAVLKNAWFRLAFVLMIVAGAAAECKDMMHMPP